MNKHVKNSQKAAVGTTLPHRLLTGTDLDRMAVILSGVLIVLLLFLMVPGSFAELAPELPPDVPRPRDPDLSSFDDPFLKEIYKKTMIGIRTAEIHPDGLEARVQAMTDFRNLPKPPEEVDYIVAAAREAVELQQWGRYRAALWSTQAGVGIEARLVAVSREMLQAPRGEKISDEHGRAMRESLEFLGRTPIESVADLLMEATTLEFWGSDPLRSRMISRDTQESVSVLRLDAVTNLGNLPSSLSLPRLEELAEKYPDKTPAGPLPPGEDRFENSAGYTIAKEIYNVKVREGIPGAINPYVEFYGEYTGPVSEPQV